MSTGITPEEERRYAELQQLALDYARQGEAIALIEMVTAGIPPNLSDHKGNTLLMLAAYHGHAETVRMLLEHGADVDRRNDRGQTPLGGVAFKGYAEVAEVLLENGADADADNGGGATPLMFAEMFGRCETAALLRRRGAGMGRRRVLGFFARLSGKVISVIRRLRHAR